MDRFESESLFDAFDVGLVGALLMRYSRTAFYEQAVGDVMQSKRHLDLCRSVVCLHYFFSIDCVLHW